MLDGGITQILAANLRRLRIARHLSLSELARATTISKATLSSIENGRANPTVETLAALAGALRVSLSDLLQELPAGEVRVLRGSRRDRTAPTQLLDTLAAGAAVEVAELSFPAGSSRELEPLPGGSRAHLYVLSGKLMAGPVERVTELGAGDYLAFPSDVAHVYETRRHAARALLLSHG